MGPAQQPQRGAEFPPGRQKRGRQVEKQGELDRVAGAAAQVPVGRAQRLLGSGEVGPPAPGGADCGALGG